MGNVTKKDGYITKKIIRFANARKLKSASNVAKDMVVQESEEDQIDKEVYKREGAAKIRLEKNYIGYYYQKR